MPTSATNVIAETQPASPTAEPDHFQVVPVVTLSAGHAVHDTYSAFLPTLLPVFIENLALSTTQAGLLSVFLQGPSLLQPFIGHLADRVNLRPLFILAPALTAMMMSLLGLAPSYGFIALFLVVVGISSASLHAVGPVLAGNLSGKNLGRGMGFWMVGGEMGRTLGPLVIVSAIQLLTLRGTPWLMLAGLLTSVILYTLLKDTPVRPSSAGQSLPWKPALRAMIPFLLPLTGILTVRSFMMSALTTYLPTFLRQDGAALWLAGVSLSVLEGAGVVGALTGGSISDRLGRRKVLFVSMLVMPLLMFVFLAVSGWLQFPLLMMMGFTGLSTTPVVMAMVQESFPQNRALANGVYMALGFVVRALMIVAWGALGDLMGLRAAFIASAIAPLLGLPLVFLLPKRQR